MYALYLIKRLLPGMEGQQSFYSKLKFLTVCAACRCMPVRSIR